MRKRLPVVTPTVEIPDVPAETLLQLQPEQWSHCATVPVGTYLEVTVARVHRNVTRQDGAGLWVWIVGHEHPGCTWEHVEPHPPCLQLMVRVDVLIAAAQRQDPPGTAGGNR
ncbi:hypothetical protein [Plantactinospora sp. CA-290183]|uniref:hypothetical protein n=1 Tax=Plantactinospora sp. CA-290183 TaxID=3240006 RepID=UPI003D8BED85